MSPRAGVRRLARAGRRVAGLVPPAARGAVFRRFGPRAGVGGAERGLVTVVVLVEDVDLPRLPDTLASIGEQSHGYREVLVAPVGPAAAAGVRRTTRERSDPRVRVLPPAGTWQEAANRAAARAHGRWLLFQRACDPLPPGSLAELTTALAASGSALAVGRVEQRGQAEEWLHRAQQATHARPGTGLAVTDRPELAGDLVVGGRMVRTDVWRSAGLEFGSTDEWLLAPTVARLLLAADEVDLLDVAATDHLADHGNRAFGATPSSLPELPGWQPRAALVEQALAGSRLLDGWLDHVVDVAVPRFLKDVERATDEEWAELRRLATSYAERVGGPDRARVESRTLLWLAGHDRRRDVEALAAEAFDLGAELPTAVEGTDLVAAWRSVPSDVPAEVRTLSPDESPLRAEVVRLRNAGGETEADLFVRVDHLDLAADGPELTAELPDGSPASVRARVDAAATRWSQSRFQAALAATVRVPAAAGPLRLRLTAGGLERSGTIALVDPMVRDPGADPRVTVRDVALEGSDLVVDTEGEPGLLRLVDDDGHDVARGAPDGTARLRFALRHEVFGRSSWLPTGWYRLVTAAGNPALAEGLTGALPVERVGPRHRLRAHVGPRGGLVVRLGPPLADDEQGPHAQERLVAAYRRHDAPVDRGTAYFESYAGRSATDSPLAVHEELRARRPDLVTYWGITDHAQAVPEGARPVLLRSREWYDLLARAGCLVVNTDVEAWFERRPGQVVLQCFHGYPSKGMGLGQWRATDLPPSRIATMRARTVEAWTVILTPTPEMTRHYREQYDYEGPALEHGYPRDDDLTAPGADARRAATRRLLGVRDDQVAVLYAPTWREHLANRPRGADMADLLDVEAAARALGEGHVLLLRGHRFHASGAPRPRGSRVVDVTAYPEINDLILAADVAVLDYSSLRFDVALTGKPMVFLVPDLADYGGGTRSFLFPFADSAPGPFVDDTAGVVEQVRDVAALRAGWAERIAAFNATYHPWQDGRATARVVDGLLALLEAPSA